MYQRKNSIFYTSACIESARIKQYHSDKKLNEVFAIHTWNEDYDAFGKQLEKRGMEKVFYDQ